MKLTVKETYFGEIQLENFDEDKFKAGQLSGSGQAAEHAETRILPSHRESVRRYFNNSPEQP